MLRPASAALLLTLSLIGCADDHRAPKCHVPAADQRQDHDHLRQHDNRQQSRPNRCICNRIIKSRQQHTT